jgi:hypothetical protein
VLAGAGIGIAAGIAVPLLHRGDLEVPPLSHWLQAAGGSVAGAMAGIVVAREF